MIAFVTGATGFIGRHVLEALLTGPFDEIRCLVRDPSRLPGVPVAEGRDAAASPARIVPVRGSLPDDLGAAADALRGCDVVIHLAAVTGRATTEDHHRVSVRGTSRLLELAAAAGVPRFVHVSTIAVKYPEKKHYPYAAAKQEAERLVRASDRDWAILRPTVVLGPGSPVEGSIASLAEAPVLPLFGGGNAVVQPVHVDDVARAILALASERGLGGCTVDFGGPEAMPWEALLRRMRIAALGKDGPALRVPLTPIIELLAALERVLPGPLPVAAGQFYAFRHDGMAAPDDRADPPLAARRTVDERIAERMAEAVAPLTEAERVARLERECSVFSRYLAGADAGDFLRRHYIRAHGAGMHAPVAPGSPDDALVAFARGGPWRARLADVYASRFDRSGPLRRKLVLMVAMLESVGETSRRVDRPTTESFAAFALGAAGRGLWYIVALPVSMLLVGRARKHAARRPPASAAGSGSGTAGIGGDASSGGGP